MLEKQNAAVDHYIANHHDGIFQSTSIVGALAGVVVGEAANYVFGHNVYNDAFDSQNMTQQQHDSDEATIAQLQAKAASTKAAITVTNDNRMTTASDQLQTILGQTTASIETHQQAVTEVNGASFEHAVTDGTSIALGVATFAFIAGYSWRRLFKVMSKQRRLESFNIANGLNN